MNILAYEMVDKLPDVVAGEDKWIPEAV